MGPRSRLTVQCILVVGSLIFFPLSNAVGFGFHLGGDHESSVNPGSNNERSNHHYGNGQYEVEEQVGAKQASDPQLHFYDAQLKSSQSDDSKATVHRENPLGISKEGASGFSAEFGLNGRNQHDSSRHPLRGLRDLFRGIKDKVGDIAEKITKPFEHEHSVKTPYNSHHHRWEETSGSEYEHPIDESDHGVTGYHHRSDSNFNHKDQTESEGKTNTPNFKTGYIDRHVLAGNHPEKSAKEHFHVEDGHDESVRHPYYGPDQRWRKTFGSEHEDNKPTSERNSYGGTSYQHHPDSNSKYDTELDEKSGTPNTGTGFNSHHDIGETSANGGHFGVGGGHDGSVQTPYHGHDFKWKTSGSEYEHPIDSLSREPDHSVTGYHHRSDSYFNHKDETEPVEKTNTPFIRTGYNHRHVSDGTHPDKLVHGLFDGDGYDESVLTTDHGLNHRERRPGSGTGYDYSGSSSDYQHAPEHFDKKGVIPFGGGHISIQHPDRRRLDSSGGLFDINSNPSKFLTNVFSKLPEELRDNLGSVSNPWNAFQKQLQHTFSSLSQSNPLEKFKIEEVLGDLKPDFSGLERILNKFKMPSLDFKTSKTQREHETNLRHPYDILPSIFGEIAHNAEEVGTRLSEQSKAFFLKLQDFFDSLKGSGHAGDISFEGLQPQLFPHRRSTNLYNNDGYKSRGSYSDDGKELERLRGSLPSYDVHSGNGYSQREQQSFTTTPLSFGDKRHRTESGSSDWYRGIGRDGDASSFEIGSQGGGRRREYDGSYQSSVGGGRSRLGEHLSSEDFSRGDTSVGGFSLGGSGLSGGSSSSEGEHRSEAGWNGGSRRGGAASSFDFQSRGGGGREEGGGGFRLSSRGHSGLADRLSSGKSTREERSGVGLLGSRGTSGGGFSIGF